MGDTGLSIVWSVVEGFVLLERKEQYQIEMAVVLVVYMNAPADSTDSSYPRQLHSGFFWKYQTNILKESTTRKSKTREYECPVARTSSQCPIMVPAIEY